MKHTSTSLILITIMMAFVSFVSCGEKDSGNTESQSSEDLARERERKAIQGFWDVYVDTWEGLDESKTWWDEYMSSTDHVRDCAKRISQIPTDGCPRDFQVAHLEFVEELRHLARTQADYEGVSAIIKGAMTLGGAVIDSYKDQEAARDRVIEAETEMKKISIAHGVN